MKEYIENLIFLVQKCWKSTGKYFEYVEEDFLSQIEIFVGILVVADILFLAFGIRYVLTGWYLEFSKKENIGWGMLKIAEILLLPILACVILACVYTIGKEFGIVI